MKIIINIIFAATFVIALSGCSSFGKKMKSLLNGGSDASQVAKGPTRFSEQSTITPGPERQYKKVTRASMEDQSRIDARSGSLWVMEGQGAYLFSENVMRLVGDPISIQLDGEPKTQLSTKVSVIKTLLAKLEARNQRPVVQTAAAKTGAAAKPGQRNLASTQATPPPPGPDGEAAAASPEADVGDVNAAKFEVQNIPTRIVERMVDGNYRVKGSQSFMIGKREYRVIVTGVVRSEDFTDNGVNASKLMEPHFDIVSANTKGANKQ